MRAVCGSTSLGLQDDVSNPPASLFGHDFELIDWSEEARSIAFRLASQCQADPALATDVVLPRMTAATNGLLVEVPSTRYAHQDRFSQLFSVLVFV
jgi:hypothetical protein